MRTFKLMFPAVLLSVGFLVCTTAYGTPDYAKKEKKACTFCHSKIESKEGMPKNLNDAGKYYRDHDHKLDGYVPKQ